MRKREEEGMDWIFRASCRKLNYLAHPRGAWASPGLCKEQFGTVYGGFQSSLVTSDWVSFDHLLLEAKPRTVIFWSGLTPNTGQDPDSCKNWRGAGRRDLPETRLGKQAGGSHFDRVWSTKLSTIERLHPIELNRLILSGGTQIILYKVNFKSSVKMLSSSQVRTTSTKAREKQKSCACLLALSLSLLLFFFFLYFWVFCFEWNLFWVSLGPDSVPGRIRLN